MYKITIDNEAHYIFPAYHTGIKNAHGILLLKEDGIKWQELSKLYTSSLVLVFILSVGLSFFLYTVHSGIFIALIPIMLFVGLYNVFLEPIILSIVKSKCHNYIKEYSTSTHQKNLLENKFSDFALSDLANLYINSDFPFYIKLETKSNGILVFKILGDDFGDGYHEAGENAKLLREIVKNFELANHI
jgi:hypothetical protein